jgi:hypothetical protein
MDKLAVDYATEWYYTNISVSIISILFSIIWIYNLSKGTNHERKEPLLTKEKEENE